MGPTTPTVPVLLRAAAHHPHHVTALIGGGLVGRDVGQAESVRGGAPGKGGAGKILGDLFEGAPILGTVRQNKIVAFLGIIANRGRGVGHDESAVGDGKIDGSILFDGVDAVDDALGERQIVAGAGRHDGDLQGLPRGAECGGGDRQGEQDHSIDQSFHSCESFHLTS